MKRILVVKTNEEKLHTKRLRMSCDETRTTILQTIPIEVIHIIVICCGTIEKHILRFICKQFHKISHKCGSTQEVSFAWDINICTYAASNGYLELLKWARKNLCYWNELVCSSAASKGHLEILKWARGNGCKWNELVCSNAALEGKLEILKWARENECPWDKRTCSNAAKGGHLEVLKWTVKNGCSWDDETRCEAESNGHLEILKWVIENKCPLFKLNM
jgi:hypothetical protein